MFLKKVINISVLLLFSSALLASPLVKKPTSTAQPSWALRLLAKAGVGSAQFQLGRFYFDQGDFKRATPYYQASFDHGYSMSESQFNIATCYFNLNDYRTARKRLKEYVLTHTDADAYFLLGVSDVELRLNKEGLIWLRKSANLGYKPAKEMLQEMR